jgi:predicted transcriptional regulator
MLRRRGRKGSSMSEQQRVSTRVDVEVIEVVRRVAEVERRPPSAVIRIALEDWAASRRAVNEPSGRAA